MITSTIPPSFLLTKKMKSRKFAITPFISLCWFSSLFAICFFSFFYLYPRDTDNCITNNNNNNNILKLDKPITTTITTSSKFLYNETIVLNSSTPKTKEFNDMIIELPTTTTTTTGNNVVFPAKLVESDATTTEVNVEKSTPKIEEESDEEYDTIPSFDEFANPPWNCSREERILWVKEKLQESKLIKSTTKTQNFEGKIQQFINPRGNNDITSCRVRIFLTWIYTSNLFGKRELLVLESIIREHLDGCVIILSRTMDSKPGRDILKPIFDRGLRVLTIAPDYHYLFSNTPGQGWLERLESGDIDPGTVPLTLNLSNLLRLAVLYKYGGVYFDNDMLLLKSVSRLQNTIGIQSVDQQTGSWSTMSNAVLIFDKGHPLLWKFMEEFAYNFDGFKWGFNGPDLATRVVSKALNDSNFQFSIMVPWGFYPIDWDRAHRLFEKSNKTGSSWARAKLGVINMESYGIHLWNRQTRGLKIEKKSVIHTLISRHCIICQNV